ncbi:MAG: hypothetical protein JWR87_2233 [Segetibacter sp.]|jgi:hypothetical protein|nr:hypothetical protein [Segetibacter sp.]
MSQKIAFIIPYYGKFPSYFPLFLNSVKEKPFDVIFFTDIAKPNVVPENVLWNLMSTTEIKTLFEKRLDISVAVERPYKLIDFKPAYGFIFESYISNYDFWGTLDVDTIMGNFSHFITQEYLNKIDFFSGITSYVSGSMFFMRNNTYCKTLFKKSRDWQHVFTNKRVLGFDECGGNFFTRLQAGESIFKLNTPIQSFTEIVLLAQKEGLRIAFTNYILEPKGSIPVTIDKEGIFYLEKEYLLVHFIYFKTTYYFYTHNSPFPFPYYINSLGTFNKKPTLIKSLFSVNMINAIRNKIKINLRKLKTRR